ncbi:MAG TPA: hypothetical protein VNO81_11760 [Candidatus Nitrosotenuis sp.]|jgi:hypothetical protein|nr:hypothetical protein [Candidatus Nitrosotenuis sp.]
MSQWITLSDGDYAWLAHQAREQGLSEVELLHEILKAYRQRQEVESLPMRVAQLEPQAQGRRRGCLAVAREAYLLFACQPVQSARLPKERLMEVASYAARHPRADRPVGAIMPDLGLPYPVPDGLESSLCKPDRQGQVRFDYWKLAESGFFLALRTGIERDGKIDMAVLARDLVEFMLYFYYLARAVCSVSGVEDSHQALFQMRDVRGKELFSAQEELGRPYVCSTDGVSVSKNWSGQGLRQHFADEAAALLDEFFLCFGGFVVPSDMVGYVMGGMLTVRD